MNVPQDNSTCTASHYVLTTNHVRVRVQLAAALYDTTTVDATVCRVYFSHVDMAFKSFVQGMSVILGVHKLCDVFRTVLSWT